MTPPSQYTPSKPDEFIGRTGKIASLLFTKAQAVKTSNAPAKWLFSGTPGTGKSRLAEILALDLAHHPCAVEQVNGQSLSVDRVREWEGTLRYKPITGERWVKVIDEIEAASAGAQMELRTYLDRIRSGTVVIATTNKEIRELPQQLQTRFFCYEFQPVTPQVYAEFAQRLWGLPLEQGVDIASRTLGCVRAALIDTEAWLDKQTIS